MDQERELIMGQTIEFALSILGTLIMAGVIFWCLMVRQSKKQKLVDDEYEKTLEHDKMIEHPNYDEGQTITALTGDDLPSGPTGSPVELSPQGLAKIETYLKRKKGKTKYKKQVKKLAKKRKTNKGKNK